jgi:hypothetical protein
MVFTYPQANTRNTYRQNAVPKESNESRGFLKPSIPTFISTHCLSKSDLFWTAMIEHHILIAANEHNITHQNSSLGARNRSAHKSSPG